MNMQSYQVISVGVSKMYSHYLKYCFIHVCMFGAKKDISNKVNSMSLMKNMKKGMHLLTTLCPAVEYVGMCYLVKLRSE